MKIRKKLVISIILFILSLFFTSFWLSFLLAFTFLFIWSSIQYNYKSKRKTSTNKIIKNETSTIINSSTSKVIWKPFTQTSYNFNHRQSNEYQPHSRSEHSSIQRPMEHIFRFEAVNSESNHLSSRGFSYSSSKNVSRTSTNNSRTQQRTSMIAPQSYLGNLSRIDLSRPKLPEKVIQVLNKPCTIPISTLPVSQFLFTKPENEQRSTGTELPSNLFANDIHSQAHAVAEALKSKRKRFSDQLIDNDQDLFARESNQAKKIRKEDGKNKSSLNEFKQQQKQQIQPPKKTSKRSNETFNLNRPAKIFKNNEILSSYTSINNNRNIAPKFAVKSIANTKSKKEDNNHLINAQTETTAINELSKFSNNILQKIEESSTKKSPVKKHEKTKEASPIEAKQLLTNNRLTASVNQIKSKPIYKLPDHLHTMEEHERDDKKKEIRLQNFLHVLKEVSSPTKTNEDKEVKDDNNKIKQK